jgi:indolepyruvate ferredoxin oxidoreductase, beta subunit
MQQIIISGVGGQGVLFVTRLLAEAALAQGCSVLISETHGMAQRGGNVISHLKVGDRKNNLQTANTEPGGEELAFSSPLIRPGRADILLALHPDALLAHSFYLRQDGKKFCNTPENGEANCINATKVATELGSAVSANLVLLGFAVRSGCLFCSPDDIERALKGAGGKREEINLEAFRAGMHAAEKRLTP